MFKTKIKNKINKYFIFFLTIPLLFLLVATIMQSKSSLTILPLAINQMDSAYEVSSYSDADGNDSGSQITKSASFRDGTISFEYKLTDFSQDQYAGITLNFYNPNDSSAPFLDVSGYSHIKLDISFLNGKKQDIYIKALVDGYTDPNENYTHGFLRKTIGDGSSDFKGEISLDEFTIPSWWIETRKLPVGCIGQPNLAEVLQINIQNSSQTPLFTPIAVTVNEIVFVKHLLPAVIPFYLIYLIYLIILFLLRFAKLDLKDDGVDDSEKIVISYDRVEIEDEQGNELERITDYISHNFADPDLTVDQLAKGAGVSTSKIPTLLKMKFSMNFKQYLNTVRITEAKRLLIDTDHQIVTIAHSVGYNNIPHFNRTFKQVTDVSPKAYRQDPKNAGNRLPGSKDK